MSGLISGIIMVRIFVNVVSEERCNTKSFFTVLLWRGASLYFLFHQMKTSREGAGVARGEPSQGSTSSAKKDQLDITTVGRPQF